MQASKCETRKTREQETKETKSEESDRNEFSKQIEARSQGGAVAIRVSAVGSGMRIPVHVPGTDMVDTCRAFGSRTCSDSNRAVYKFIFPLVLPLGRMSFLNHIFDFKILIRYLSNRREGFV